MRARTPKVLHRLAGLPMIGYPVATALAAGAQPVVVVLSANAEPIVAALDQRFGPKAVEVAIQPRPLGTADAVAHAEKALGRGKGPVLILYGDTPLVTPGEILLLVRAYEKAGTRLAVVTCRAEDPSGYGRVLRDAEGRIVAVREHADCTAEQRLIREVNAGIYLCDRKLLFDAIGGVGTKNKQREFYLPDILAEAAHDARGVVSVEAAFDRVRGVNDASDLAAAQSLLRVRIVQGWIAEGVQFADPARVEIDHDVTLSAGVWLGTAVALRGKTRVAEGARLDNGCVVEDSTIGPNATLLPYSVVGGSEIGEGARVGPFAHLRAGTVLGPGVHVGNFVETKKTQMAQGSKANHLAYLGDGRIGRDVNVGAGTIFCNYDGFAKYPTTIEDGAFIGSNSSLVAPVTVGARAYVATGSVVTADVPPDALAIARTRQENKPGYAAKLRKLKTESATAKKPRALKKG